MILKCSSTDEGVDLTWQVNPSNVTFHPMTINNTLMGLAFFTQDQIQLNCSSSRDMENISEASNMKCHGENTKKPPLNRVQPFPIQS